VSKILIISPEQWHGNFVSKHHYATEVARLGHDVLFYGPPTKSGKILIENVQNNGTNLRVIHAPRVAYALRYMPERVRRFLEEMWLRQIEVMTGGIIDVVWLFENSRFFDMRFAGERLKIYHQVDIIQAFNPGLAAKTSDVTIALNNSICQMLKTFTPDKSIHIVSHGLSLPQTKTNSIDTEIFTKGIIHAAYIGNLGMKYIDVDAFTETVSRHKDDVRFHLFGKYDESMSLRKELKDKINVVWWGWQQPEMIQEYLKYVDINMLVYKSKENVKQLANSHKILEYLYSGKVTVSSYVDDYKDIHGLLEMINLYDSYAERFDNVVAKLNYYNSEKMMARRKEYALRHTYKKKLEMIISIIENECNVSLR
jgi:glycosyltransferase involved in cell wall biosynthesis